MNENIYVVDNNGLIIGLKDRKYVHENGLLHLAVQCWVINKKGEVLIQRRSATKDKSAGKWDVSFGGHCVEGSSYLNALIDNVVKEGMEELGLKINPTDVIKLGEIRYISQENKNKEMIGVFLIHVDDNITFSFNDGEVSDVSWINPTELYIQIKENKDQYANRLSALELLINYFECKI